MTLFSSTDTVGFSTSWTSKQTYTRSPRWAHLTGAGLENKQKNDYLKSPESATHLYSLDSSCHVEWLWRLVVKEWLLGIWQLVEMDSEWCSDNVLTSDADVRQIGVDQKRRWIQLDRWGRQRRRLTLVRQSKGRPKTWSRLCLCQKMCLKGYTPMPFVENETDLNWISESAWLNCFTIISIKYTVVGLNQSFKLDILANILLLLNYQIWSKAFHWEDSRSNAESVTSSAEGISAKSFTDLFWLQHAMKRLCKNQAEAKGAALCNRRSDVVSSLLLHFETNTCLLKTSLWEYRSFFVCNQYRLSNVNNNHRIWSNKKKSRNVGKNRLWFPC